MRSHFLPNVETNVFGVEYDGERLMKFRLEIPVLGWQRLTELVENLYQIYKIIRENSEPLKTKYLPRRQLCPTIGFPD